MIDVLNDLQNRIERTQNLLERLEQAMQCAKQGDYQFKVCIISAWRDYGGQNGVGEGCTLQEAETAAEADFRQKNGKGKIQQARRTVTITFPNGFAISPHSFLPD